MTPESSLLLLSLSRFSSSCGHASRAIMRLESRLARIPTAPAVCLCQPHARLGIHHRAPHTLPVHISSPEPRPKPTYIDTHPSGQISSSATPAFPTHVYSAVPKPTTDLVVVVVQTIVGLSKTKYIRCIRQTRVVGLGGSGGPIVRVPSRSIARVVQVRSPLAGCEAFVESVLG
ncbi:hypothetical protein C8F01DRAFT_799119 [Mycena amicta]|nr:hypothetical protein C8F01DRAFT_799119 [Mycena amicta]